MYAKFITSIILIPLLLIFAIQNGGLANVSFLFINMDIPLVVVIVIAAVLGFFISMGVSTLTELKLKKALHKRNMEIKKLKKEVAALNNSTFVRDIKALEQKQTDAEPKEIDIAKLVIKDKQGRQYAIGDTINNNKSPEVTKQKSEKDTKTYKSKKDKAFKNDKTDTKKQIAQETYSKADENKKESEENTSKKSDNFCNILNFDDKDMKLNFKKKDVQKKSKDIPWYMGNHPKDSKKDGQAGDYQINLKKEFEDYMRYSCPIPEIEEVTEENAKKSSKNTIEEIENTTLDDTKKIDTNLNDIETEQKISETGKIDENKENESKTLSDENLKKENDIEKLAQDDDFNLDFIQEKVAENSSLLEDIKLKLKLAQKQAEEKTQNQDLQNLVKNEEIIEKNPQKDVNHIVSQENHKKSEVRSVLNDETTYDEEINQIEQIKNQKSIITFNENGKGNIEEDLNALEHNSFNFLRTKQNTSPEKTLSKELVAKKFNWKTPRADYADYNLQKIEKAESDNKAQTDLKSKIRRALKVKKND